MRDRAESGRLAVGYAPNKEWPARRIDAPANRKIRRRDSKHSLVTITVVAKAQMSLAPGTRIGPYELLATIGEGGMGEVYRARDARLGRNVAVKILPPSFSDSPDRLRRLEQEARATSALNHPNVVVVHDTGQHEGSPYIVYELLEGGTLRQLLTGTPLSTSRVIGYAIEIARGLAAAHDRGIVHRDLKPENIFITLDERVKVLDFGIARVV